MINLVSPSEAKDLLDNDGINVVGFKAPWCPQCEPQRGVVERLVSQFQTQVNFAYVDLDTHPEAQEMFNLRGLPALHIAKNGETRERLSRFTSAPKLNQLLQQLCN